VAADLTPDAEHLPPGSAHSRAAGIVFILLAALAWSFPALAIKHLTKFTDIYTQNFYRFASACAVLWIICLVRFRRETREELGILLRLLPAAVICFAYQICWVKALYIKDFMPGLAYLITKCTVIFNVLLSVAFFADERSIVRDKRFIIGLALALIGMAGFLPAGQGDGATTTPIFWGVLLVMLGSFFWALYTVLIKLLVRRGSPIVAYTYLCTAMLIAFTGLTAAFGDFGALLPNAEIGWWPLLIAIASGAICVGGAHVLYYYGIRVLGTTVCGTTLLASSFLTPLFSFWWFDETFQLLHILAAAVLIVGGMIALHARPDKPQESA
jgi:drug/metabolite transporter (DMT)-like permease